MKKKEYFGIDSQNLFTAVLRHEADSNVGVLILSGDGSSDAVKCVGSQDGETFETFIKREVPAACALVIDATHLYRAKSSLHYLLSDLLDRERAIMIIEGNGEAKSELVIPLRRTFGIGPDAFTEQSLRDSILAFGAPEDLAVLVEFDKSCLKQKKPLSPETNYICEAKGTTEVTPHVAKVVLTLNKVYEAREGWFKHDNGIVIMTDKVLRLPAHRYIADLLAHEHLLDPLGTDERMMKPSRLEHVVKELFDNSRGHGYGGSDAGIIFLHYRKTDDALEIYWDDFGGMKSFPHIKGGSVGLAEIEQEIKSLLDETHQRSGRYGIRIEPGIPDMSDAERATMTERAEKLRKMLKRERLEPIGPGHRVILCFPRR